MRIRFDTNPLQDLQQGRLYQFSLLQRHKS